jgi:hypothetical protein
MKIYCKYCNKITKHHEKGLRTPVTVCNKCSGTNMPITLIKSNGEKHFGTQVKFVEWSAEELGSRAKQLHDEPQVEYSCIIDPQYAYQYTWLTTPITEIIEDKTEKDIRTITFKTKNSDYTLHICTTPQRENEINFISNA